jgi:hypothetical protein
MHHGRAVRDVLMLRDRAGGVPASRLRDRAIALLVAHRAFPDRGLVVESFLDERSGWVLVHAEPAGIPERGRDMYKGAHEALTYSGYVGLPDRSGAAVRSLLDLRRGGILELGAARLEVRASPGGVAAFFVVYGETGFAWSSHAGVEGVFRTEADALAISNRPLLSHLAATGATAPRMSAAWGRRVLAGDSSLWGDTPFEGTRALAPRSMLVVARRKVRVLPHPVVLPCEGGEPLAAAARRAIEVVRGLPVPELQLSGGKDSRMIAALVAAAGIEVDAVTYAPSHGGEAIVARRVADALGLPHRLVVRRVELGDALLPQVLRNLRRSDGMLGENRALAYADLDYARDQPMLEGQAHNPRGGFITEMRASIDDVRARLHGQLGGDPDLVAEDAGAERRARIDMLVRHVPRRHPADAAYWMYNDWRPPLLHGPYLASARFRRTVYPMADERVLAACAALPTYERATERAFFEALIALAPAMAGLPLYDGRWRFDERGPTPFPVGFATRSVPVLDAQPPEQGRPRPPLGKRMSTVRPLFVSAMHDLGSSAEVRGWIRPEVLAALLRDDEASSALGVDNQRLVRFAWKASAVALVLDGGWLR